MDAFFTKKELAERWKCSESAINQMIADGKLKPSKKLPGVRIPASQILRMEEATSSEMSRIEARKLMKRITELEAENKMLRNTMHRIWMPLVDFMKGVS